MSSTPTTPDQSTLSQTVAAPDVQMTPGPMPQVPQTPPQQPTLAPQGSRLGRILQAVASVAAPAVSSIPDKGRSTFVTGLGEGARAEQAAQAQQQQIKFQNFQDQVRIANLHAQDLQKQAADDATLKAQQSAEDFQREAFESNGGKFDIHPNNGEAVTQTLKSQTQANGAASIPPGTHISANGTDILMPNNSPATLSAQVQNYKALQGILPGLPSLPSFDPTSVKSSQDVTNARQQLGQHLDIMQHILQGYNYDGSPLSHDQLNNLIPAYQAQIDSLTKNGGASPYQLGTLKNTLVILQANAAHHQDVEDQVAQNAAQLKTNQQKQVIQARGEAQQAVNAAKPQKVVNNDWVPGASADEKKKAELAENMTLNANNIASLLQRRPDLVGSVAGRFTSLEQMAGSNDPDIVSLGTDIHNIGMANAGIHGLRSLDAANDYGKVVLNNFKNGPAGIYGGLKSSVDSVQTFIDNARPDTYRTHSKQGGAIKAMVPQKQG